MANLLYITCEYPDEHGDSDFIINEMNIISKKFDNVVVFSHGNGVKVITNLPNNVKVSYSGKLGLVKKIIYLIKCLFSKVFYKEINYLLKNHKFSFGSLKMSLSFLVNSFFDYSQINDIIRRNKIDITFSYWFWYSTLALCFVKQRNNIPCCTRVHGFDLYEYRNPCNYQPYKTFMNKWLDKIFFISKQGMNYFEQNICESINYNHELSYLGIKKLNFGDEQIFKIIKNKITIVSCSYLVPLKRVNLIIDSLAKINNSIDIEWYHIGLGDNLSDVEYAKLKLDNKKNISYTFLGNMCNDDILQFYFSTHIDLFVNMSETEGVPVSMMEAMAYSIPICGTDVGGVKELVDNEIGCLLTKDNCVEEFVNFIYYYNELSENAILNMRKKAYNKWNLKFNAKRNYEDFSSKLLSII